MSLRGGSDVDSYDPPRPYDPVVVEFLDVLAFDDASEHKEFAQQVLGEWWVPDALYRPRPG